MTDDNFARASSGEPAAAASQHSTCKPRRKRKWDQPDESLVSSGILPMSIVGFPGVSVPGTVSVSSSLLTNSLKASCMNGSTEVQTPPLEQQVAAVVQKLIQPKIQEELMIAREVVINDADPAIRYKLTKRQTQEEIQKCTGAVVITRGKYRPPNGVPDGEKPLYLHISAGAHLKETPERILAVDRAAAMVEEMLKQVSKPLSTCVYLGFDADPSLNIAARIRGPNDQYINHIMNETGATVVLCGRGSGHNTQGEEGQQPLHLFLSSNNQKSLEDARLLAENLLDTISRECGATRVASCKVYNAVPPPQQLLVGVQSSEAETNSNLNSGASSVCSVATCVLSPVSSVGASTVRNVLPHRQVAQPGGHLPSQTNGQPLLTGCTSYSGYAGIYPQVTPLQQVAQALGLRQSGPITSTVAPVAVTSTTNAISNTSSYAVRQPPHKRKFQELPTASVRAPVLQQGTFIKDSPSHKCPLIMEEISAALAPSKKLDSPASKETAAPSLKSILRPPSPPTPGRNTCSMPPSASKSMPPPPRPPSPPAVFISTISLNRTSDEEGSISKKSNATIVPDTLVKLMEYGNGEDDDDAEENEHETIKSNPNRIAASKPFWAV